MFKNAASKIAHNSTLPALAVGNQDIRPLQDLITSEKNVLISIQRLSVDLHKSAENLRTWGVGEGDDLGDTLSASSTLLNAFSSALTEFASHGHAVRDALKNVRKREEDLDELKRRRKSVASKADGAEKKLSRMSPEHKNVQMQTETLNRLQEEIRQLDSQIMTEEASLGDYKRTVSRKILAIKFGGLQECCDKGTIYAEYGKLVIGEIPELTTQPGMSRPMYLGHSKVNSLLDEGLKCAADIRINTSISSDSRPRHTGQEDNSFNSPAAPWSPQIPWSPELQGNGSNSLSNDYIPTPTGLGNSHLFSPSELPTIAPLSIHHSSPPHNTVDDFGVNLNYNQPDQSGAAARFATFPVKGPNRGGQLQGGHSPKLSVPSPGRDAPDSFSSSIEDALRNAGHSNEPAPAYDPIPQPSHSTGPVASGVDVGPNPWGAGAAPGAGQGGGLRQSMVSDGDPYGYVGSQDSQLAALGSQDVHLAYMGSTESHLVNRGGREEQLGYAGNEDGQQRSHTGNEGLGPQHDTHLDSAGSRHIRFGEVSTIEDQKSHPQSQESDDYTETSQRIKSPAEQEHELNAAAAREVSREMDTLNFSPPPMPQPQYPSQTQGPPEPERTFSPLAPPSAPFANRAVSPNYAEAVSDPAMTSAQSYAHAHRRSDSLSPQGTPTQPAKSLPAHPALHINLDSPSLNPPNPLRSPAESFSTPPEYITPRGLGPFQSRSTASVSSAVSPGGPGKISAAAFRRGATAGGAPGTPRLGSMDTRTDTPPLSFQKRLPSGPQPDYRGPPGQQIPNSISPAPAEDEYEPYDYISPYSQDSSDRLR